MIFIINTGRRLNMAVNYWRINGEIVKIGRGLGYTIQMYDDQGNGPISDPAYAKYIYFAPVGIMISVPIGNSSERDEIFIYVGKEKDKLEFQSLRQRLKVLAHLNGLGLTIRNFESDRVVPKDFADEARIAKDNAE